MEGVSMLSALATLMAGVAIWMAMHDRQVGFGGIDFGKLQLTRPGRQQVTEYHVVSIFMGSTALGKRNASIMRLTQGLPISESGVSP